MKTCITPDCNRQFIGGGHCRCHQCREKLNAKGLCCFCGDAPRASPLAKYCAQCLGRIAELGEKWWKEYDGEILPLLPQPKYRDADARENTYETRRGRD